MYQSADYRGQNQNTPGFLAFSIHFQFLNCSLRLSTPEWSFLIFKLSPSLNFVLFALFPHKLWLQCSTTMQSPWVWPPGIHFQSRCSPAGCISQLWSRASKHTNTKYTQTHAKIPPLEVCGCTVRWRLHNQLCALWNGKHIHILFVALFHLFFAQTADGSAQSRWYWQVLSPCYNWWFMTEGRSEGNQPTTGHQNKVSMCQRKSKEDTKKMETNKNSGWRKTAMFNKETQDATEQLCECLTFNTNIFC